MSEHLSGQAPVVAITRKVDDLKSGIRDSLTSVGEARANLAGTTTTTDEWRKVARAVARELGRPVLTIARDSYVWAMLRDWPATPHELAINEEALRGAMEKMNQFGMGSVSG